MFYNFKCYLYANLFSRIMKNYFNILSYYLIAPIIAFFIVFFYLDLNIFKYGESILFAPTDGISVMATAKLITKEGLTYCSKYVGYPQIDTNCFADYTLNNSIIQFWIIKFFSFFSKSPFIASYYYGFVVIFLIAFSANFCFRKIGISKFNSTLLAVLFSITNNKIFYFNTLSVGNYFIIPFTILMSFWVIDGKLVFIKINENGQAKISPNKYFYYSLLISFFASASSAYYGYACIILLALSGFIFFIGNTKSYQIWLSIISSLFIFVVIAILINSSALIFWMEHGFIASSARLTIESVLHEMAIAPLMLPIEDHVIKSFGEFAIQFKEAFFTNSGEKSVHQLGLFASIGFCSLLIFSLISLFLIHKNDLKYRFYGLEFTKEKYYVLSVLASLNLLMIVFFCSGFYLFLHFYFSQVRATARLNVIFIFLALTFFGIIFDQLISQKKIFKKTIFTKIFIVIICSLALVDAVGGPTKISKNFANYKKNYENHKAFVENIEQSLPLGSKIFMMPVKGFPEAWYDDYQSTIGYIFGKELKFSYPAPKNRKSHLWQREVADLQFQDFVKEVRIEGFAGIWIQRNIFEKIETKIKLVDFENNVKKIAKNSIESSDKIFVFYEI
jgi:hypothetical protein